MKTTVYFTNGHSVTVDHETISTSKDILYLSDFTELCGYLTNENCSIKDRTISIDRSIITKIEIYC